MDRPALQRRLWLDGLIAGRFTSTAEIALYERCSERAVRITLSRLPFPNIAGKKRGAASTAPKLCKPAPMGGCGVGSGLLAAEKGVSAWLSTSFSPGLTSTYIFF
ncbi:MAG: hypothetical protein K0R61_3492, partial [Microvirga sp.]|nr:hypothetical protein [Microvirga sp.]